MSSGQQVPPGGPGAAGGAFMAVSKGEKDKEDSSRGRVGLEGAVEGLAWG